MGKNQRRCNPSPTTTQEPSQAKKMHSPIPTAGNQGKYELPLKKILTVPIKHSHDRTTGIVGPGRASQNNQIPIRKTGFRKWLNGKTLPEKSQAHHHQGTPHRTDGKTKRLGRAYLFPYDINPLFFQPMRQAVQQVSGLAAKGIVKNQNTLGGHCGDTFWFINKLFNCYTKDGQLYPRSRQKKSPRFLGGLDTNTNQINPIPRSRAPH